MTQLIQVIQVSQTLQASGPHAPPQCRPSHGPVPNRAPVVQPRGEALWVPADLRQKALKPHSFQGWMDEVHVMEILPSQNIPK